MTKELLHNLLLNWPHVVIRDQDITSQFPGDDQRRYDLVNRALIAKVLEQLKRGVYLILPPYQKHLPNSFEIAQILYGPSYISFESALSHHGLIPEAVYATTSACIKRSNTIQNGLGIFRYLHVPEENFTLGVDRIQDSHSIYLLASPWKALADLCYVQKKRWHNLTELCGDLRIEKEELQSWDPKVLDDLVANYGSSQVRKILSKLKK